MATPENNRTDHVDHTNTTTTTTTTDRGGSSGLAFIVGAVVVVVALLASRGSSVLVDNVRGGQFNLSGMTETEARAHGIDPGERRQFVRLVQAKANFGAPIPDMWFRRADGGILLPAGIERMDDGGRQGGPGANAQARGGRRGA